MENRLHIKSQPPVPKEKLFSKTHVPVSLFGCLMEILSLERIY